MVNLEDIARIILEVTRQYTEGDSILQLVEDVSNGLKLSFDSHRNVLIEIMLENKELAFEWAVDVLG